MEKCKNPNILLNTITADINLLGIFPYAKNHSCKKCQNSV